MSRNVRRLVLIALCAAGLAPATAAEAQWYGGNAGQRPPPLYPYELQPGQPPGRSYAVEVAPGTYIIRRPRQLRGVWSTAPRRRLAVRVESAARARKHTHANRARIEELRRRDAQRAAEKAAKRVAAAKRAAAQAAKQSTKHAAKRHERKADKVAGRKPNKIIHTRKIVREKPLVVETRRVVEDPPKIITRRHYVDALPPPRPRGGVTGAAPAPAANVNPRVIHAEAEITILGPDRMSIRLVRKRGEPLVIGTDALKRVKKRTRKRK